MKSFQALLSRYDLTSEQLMSLISLLRINPNVYRQHLTFSEFSKKNEELQRQYRLSGFFSEKEALEARQKSLIDQYPEVSKYMREKRLDFLKEIQSVFFNDVTPIEHHLKTKGSIKELRMKLRSHAKEIQEKYKRNGDIGEVIEEMIEKMNVDYKGYLLDTKAFFDSFVPVSKQLTSGSGEISQKLVDKQKETLPAGYFI